ncbi:amidohydrolase family protein [Saccharopolyspora sp. NPDC050642]|uniref:amidohydrolase family protein n=1 Tax=Saccharopolyspora sp. NPDC050642 TaxID=3157099 RepID=UPI0033FC95DA
MRVYATVLVQTLAEESETVEFLGLATDSAGLIAAVVGWVDLTAPDVSQRLSSLRAVRGGELLRAIRHPVLAEPDPCWLDRPDVRRGLAALAAADLSYDLLIQQPQWDAALRLAHALPDLPLILDHAGNPPINGP